MGEVNLAAASSAPPSPAARGLLWRLWLGCWFLFVTLAHGNLESTDTAVTMQGSLALWRRGDSGLLQRGAGAQWLAEAMLADHIVAAAPNGLGRTGQDGRHHYVWFPIGHLGALVPFVALGEQLARAFPAVEAEYERRAGFWYHEGQFVFAQGAIAMLLPPIVGATTIVLLWLLARRLGCTDRQALLVALAVMFGTQCLATARETISNGCGLVFLLASLQGLLCCHSGAAARRHLLLAGACAGAAVLCRYQQAVMLLPLGWLLVLVCRRQRRVAPLCWFVLGGLPFAIVLLAVNHARFGDALVTGYPPAGSWLFNYPPWLGALRMFVAGSKGILWLSPLLWLAVPLLLRAVYVPQLRWLPWCMFFGSVLLFSSFAGGWQSGQCWGSRYVTDGIVVFVLWALAQGRPWQRWPRRFWTVFAIGVFVNVTQVVSPVRGHAQLAAQALLADTEQAVAAGRLSPADLAGALADPPDRFYQEWRFSVLHANWRYAWQSVTGGFEDDSGNPTTMAAASIGAVFGIDATDPQRTMAPSHWEDRQFRHLGWKFWGDLLGVPWWLLLLPVLGAATAMSWAAWRRLSKN